MEVVAFLLKPFFYVAALAAGWYAFRGHGRHWGNSTTIELISVALAAIVRLGAGIAGFFAVAIWVNAQFGSDSDSRVLQVPALAVLGVIGLVLWIGTAAITFRRAPWWKRIAFGVAAELMSLVLDYFMQSGSDGGVWRLKDLILSGRGLGGC